MHAKYLTLIGTALTLALTSNVAVAQSDKFLISQSSGQSSSSSGEVKLSPEGKKILCQNFPLNSRCQEGSASTPSSSDSTGSSSDKKKPAEGNVPGSTAIPGKAPNDPGTTGIPNGTIDVPPAPAGNPAIPGGSGDQQIQPGGTTGAPDTAIPGGSSVPSDSGVPGGSGVPGDSGVPGTAPADPGTTGNPNGTIDTPPPPSGNPSSPGGSRSPSGGGSQR